MSIALKDIVVAFEAIAPDLGCPDAIGTATIESVTVDTSLAIALAGTGAILVDVPELEVQITEPVLDITDGFTAFFDWAFKNGKKMAEELDYVALPDAVTKLISDTAWSQIKR